MKIPSPRPLPHVTAGKARPASAPKAVASPSTHTAKTGAPGISGGKKAKAAKSFESTSLPGDKPNTPGFSSDGGGHWSGH